MKKEMIAIGCAAVMIVFCACGGQLSDDTGNMAGMINPMVEYETFPDLEAVIDFEYLIIPESNGFHCEDIYLISDTTVDLEYDSKDNDEIEACVRTAKGTDDITGYYGAEYKDVKIGEITVHKGEYQGSAADDYVRLAWWTDGTFCYSVSFEKLQDETVFDSLLESAVEASTFLNKNEK